jgi:23S rRNA pseudouridine1911/1915/1917 synthase
MQILHEDDELIVFNKPPGLPSTAQQGQDSGTAVHEALARFPQLPFAGTLERGLLHRLDTGTSGALAFAKTEAAYSHYRSTWKSEVGKIYRAVVSRSEKADPAAVPELLARLPREIRLEIGHDAKSSRRMRVLDPRLALPMKEQLRRVRGRPQTSHTILERAHELAGSHLDVEIRITTGVMHQIRVILAHLGIPIMGDEIYRGEKSSRLWLHAWKLVLAGRTIEAPLPPDWPK